MQGPVSDMNGVPGRHYSCCLPVRRLRFKRRVSGARGLRLPTHTDPWLMRGQSMKTTLSGLAHSPAPSTDRSLHVVRTRDCTSRPHQSSAQDEANGGRPVVTQ